MRNYQLSVVEMAMCDYVNTTIYYEPDFNWVIYFDLSDKKQPLNQIQNCVLYLYDYLYDFKDMIAEEHVEK